MKEISSVIQSSVPDEWETVRKNKPRENAPELVWRPKSHSGWPSPDRSVERPHRQAISQACFKHDLIFFYISFPLISKNYSLLTPDKEMIP
jgi:hypothetical protein